MSALDYPEPDLDAGPCRSCAVLGHACATRLCCAECEHPDPTEDDQ